MGKAKKADNSSLCVDLKSAIALDPDEKAEWLTSACKHVADGTIRVSQVFDVITHQRFLVNLPDKINLRMARTLQKHMRLFSEKQQRFLNQCPLITEFEAKQAEVARAKLESRQAAQKTAKKGDESNALYEEMMARVRGFVRENANSYEERERELQRRQEREILDQEWEQIELWHRPFEDYEKAQMTKDDWRLFFKVLEAEDAQRQAVENWRKESWEKARQADLKRRLEDEREILEQLLRAEERRKAQERFLAQEAERRAKEEEQIERRRQERLRKEQDRLAREREHFERKEREEEERRRKAQEWRIREQKKVEEEKLAREELQRKKAELERRKQEEDRRKQNELEAQWQRADRAQRAVEEARQRAAVESRRRTVTEEITGQLVLEQAQRRERALLEKRNASDEQKRKESESKRKESAPVVNENEAKRMRISISTQNSTNSVSSTAPSVVPLEPSSKTHRDDEPHCDPMNTRQRPSDCKPASNAEVGVDSAVMATNGDHASGSRDSGTTAQLQRHERHREDRHKDSHKDRQDRHRDREKDNQRDSTAKDSTHHRNTIDGAKEKKAKEKKDKKSAADSPSVPVATAPSSREARTGWMLGGTTCDRCQKKVMEHGGVVCGRRRQDGRMVGCGEKICWRCMNRALRTDFGAVKTTKAEFESLGQNAWWMHQTCMEPEDEKDYFGDGEDGLEGNRKSVADADDNEDAGGRFAWE